jgi:glycosyltransferase involved in cell wall biosynthesis
MDRPLVSAVIPAHNAERWISVSVNSVLEQSWPRMECIVVDDGSRDATASVVRRFGNRVRLISTSNNGVARARNCGIGQARGDYIAFLDADDVWKPSKIERQMELFRQDPGLGLVYTALEIVDQAGQTISVQNAPEPCAVQRQTLLLGTPSVGLAQSGVIPAAVLREIGAFDERLSTSADGDLVCRIAAKHPVAAVQTPLTLYRQHPGQMHENLAAFEHDMRLVFEKQFSPEGHEDIQPLRRCAFASLYLTLAVANARRSRWPLAAKQALHAAMTQPLYTVVTAKGLVSG